MLIPVKEPVNKTSFTVQLLALYITAMLFHSFLHFFCLKRHVPFASFQLTFFLAFNALLFFLVCLFLDFFRLVILRVYDNSRCGGKRTNNQEIFNKGFHPWVSGR